MAFGFDAFGNPTGSQSEFGQPTSTGSRAQPQPVGPPVAGPPDPNATPTAGFDPLKPYATNDTFKKIQSAYTTFLGRTPDYDEIMENWSYAVYDPIQADDAISKIQNSPEAQAYKTKQAVTTQPPVTPVMPFAQPQQQPASQDPFASIGGGVQLPTGEWVPKGHPLAQGVTTSGGTTSSTTLSYDPTFTPMLQAIGISPVASTNFTPPVQNQFAPQISALMQAILAKPETLNAEAVNTLKRQNIEEANSIAKQFAQRSEQDTANRGMFNSGQRIEQGRLIDESTLNSIIRGNRAVDLEKVSRDRQDQLAALTMADALASGDVDRFGKQYESYMGGFGTAADAYTKAKNLKVQQDIASLENALGWGRVTSGDQQFYAGLANTNENALLRAILGL